MYPLHLMILYIISNGREFARHGHQSQQRPYINGFNTSKANIKKYHMPCSSRYLHSDNHFSFKAFLWQMPISFKWFRIKLKKNQTTFYS